MLDTVLHFNSFQFANTDAEIIDHQQLSSINALFWDFGKQEFVFIVNSFGISLEPIPISTILLPNQTVNLELGLIYNNPISQTIPINSNFID